MFASIEKSIDSLKAKASAPITAESMFGSMEKDILNLNRNFNMLIGSIEDLIDSADGEILDFLPPNLVKDLNSAITATSNFSKAIKEAQSATGDLAAEQNKLLSLETKMSKAKDTLEIRKASRQAMEAEVAASRELRTEAKKTQEERAKTYQKAKKDYDDLLKYYKDNKLDESKTAMRGGKKVNL
jgi:hypothetical protein